MARPGRTADLGRYRYHRRPAGCAMPPMLWHHPCRAPAQRRCMGVRRLAPEGAAFPRVGATGTPGGCEHRGPPDRQPHPTAARRAWRAAARPTCPPERHIDGAGPMPVVQPAGSRSWVMLIQHRRRRRAIGPGRHTVVSPPRARGLALETRRAIPRGRPLLPGAGSWSPLRCCHKRSMRESPGNRPDGRAVRKAMPRGTRRACSGAIAGPAEAPQLPDRRGGDHARGDACRA